MNDGRGQGTGAPNDGDGGQPDEEGLALRRATMDDFEALLMLFRQLWPGKAIEPDRLREVFVRAVSVSSRQYICALVAGQVVGVVGVSYKDSLWLEGRVAYVEELVVVVTHRGKGIGTRLLQHVKEMAMANGCGRMELDAAFHRSDSHRFYDRLGMTKRAWLFTLDLGKTGAQCSAQDRALP